MFVSCEKDAEKLFEVVKNENGESKVEFDDQNRIAKIVWYDKKDDVFKKTTFKYGDDIRLKIEAISHDEYLMIGEYTKLDDKIILKTDKKLWWSIDKRLFSDLQAEMPTTLQVVLRNGDRRD